MMTSEGLGGGGSTSPTLDPLAQWIQHRTRDFQDFDASLGAGSNSLIQQQPDHFQLPSLFPTAQQPYLTAQQPDLFSTLGRRSQLQHQEPYRLEEQRSSQMDDRELSPRAQVTIDADKLQVEFNVQEYKPEELSIKTEGDVLVVLGKQEVKDGGQTFVSKQFEQRFSLPSGAKPENISSALSKDGVLTVTAARDPPAIKGRSKQAIENNSNQVFQQSAQTKGDGLPQPRVKYDDNTFQISLDAQMYRPDDLDVKVEGNNIIITAKQEVKEAGGTRTRVFEQKFSMPSGVQGDKVSSSLTRDGVLVITAPRGGNTSANSYTNSIENSMNKVLNPSSWGEEDRKREVLTTHQREPVPTPHHQRESAPLSTRQGSIFDRPSLLDDGGFFDRKEDSFFDRKEDSIFDRKGSLFDNERSIIANNSEASGVSRVEYDDHNYKIHVNVQNFSPEELVVKTVDQTVKVDAKHEEKTGDGHTYSTKSFSQSFTLPRGVNPDSISSALSKDGVLTISAPLPPALKSNNGERMVQIKKF